MFLDLGKSGTVAETGDGEWVMRWGDSNGSAEGFGFGNRRERSMRGGRSLRLESLEVLEFLELREREEGSGLNCL